MVDIATVNAITGGDTFEHEAHDCQRLVTDEGSRFGPLVGVFPLDQAMVPGLEGGFDGGPVASLLNFDADGTPGTAYLPFNVSADPDDAWSCIEIDAFSDSDTVTTARIFTLAARTCLQPEVGGNPAEYDVRISTHPLPGGVPPTARFRWDHEARGHYIGLRCGEKWCSIYPQGVTPSEPLRWDDDEVGPGYFDEQHLAVDSVDGFFVPGPWSRIEPSAALAEMDASDITGDELVHVATITAFDDPTRFETGSGTNYATKFNLVKRGNVWVADVWLRVGSGGVGGETRFAGADPALTVSPPEFMTMEHGAPGSVRWRWLADDEGGWIYCVSGCCSVKGGD